MKRARKSRNEEDWRLAKAERNRVGRQVQGKKSKQSKIALIDRETGGVGGQVEEQDTSNFINKFFSGIGPKLFGPSAQ